MPEGALKPSVVQKMYKRAGVQGKKNGQELYTVTDVTIVRHIEENKTNM